MGSPSLFSRVVISCEHGGNDIPATYLSLFRSRQARSALADHRGWDIGAAPLAGQLSDRLNAALYVCTTSRLLIDQNRSLHHRSLFSTFSNTLSPSEKRQVIAEIYQPHRAAILAELTSAGRTGKPILHLAVHSFTPQLHGESRNADVGLLYAPTRVFERDFCLGLKDFLQHRLPALRVRRNYPYRGTADGLTTALRKTLPERHYAGIELELNQACLKRVAPTLVDALGEFIATRVAPRSPHQR